MKAAVSAEMSVITQQTQAGAFDFKTRARRLMSHFI